MLQQYFFTTQNTVGYRQQWWLINTESYRPVLENANSCQIGICHPVTITLLQGKYNSPPSAPAISYQQPVTGSHFNTYSVAHLWWARAVAWHEHVCRHTNTPMYKLLEFQGASGLQAKSFPLSFRTRRRIDPGAFGMGEQELGSLQDMCLEGGKMG